MSLCADAELRTVPGFRVMCAPTVDGFAAVIPVSGERLVGAVGVISPEWSAGGTPRDEMRAVLHDQSMVEGHDATTLLHRTNVELGRRGLGHIDALALVCHSDAGMHSWASGAGDPAPLVVTRDRLSAPAGEGAPLGDGWAVVLGSAQSHSGPFAGLLSPDDVRRALAVLDEPEAPTVSGDRTMLALAVAPPC